MRGPETEAAGIAEVHLFLLLREQELSTDTSNSSDEVLPKQNAVEARTAKGDPQKTSIASILNSNGIGIGKGTCHQIVSRLSSNPHRQGSEVC